MSGTAQTLFMGFVAPSRHRAAREACTLARPPLPVPLSLPRSSLCEYLKESRNMKKVQDPCVCVIGEDWAGEGDVRG